MPRVGAFNFIDEPPAPQPAPRAQPMPAAAPQSPPPPSMPDPAMMLERMVAKAKPAPVAAPVAPPQKFVPGKRPEPKSGMTASQLLRDQATLKSLMSEVAKWESQNPSRKLLGPAVKGMMPNVSDAQARTIAKKLNAERQRMTVARSSADSTSRAAAAAMKR